MRFMALKYLVRRWIWRRVESALDQKQPELRIFVLPVAIDMLAHINGLLDKHVKIVG